MQHAPTCLRSCCLVKSMGWILQVDQGRSGMTVFCLTLNNWKSGVHITTLKTSLPGKIGLVPHTPSSICCNVSWWLLLLCSNNICHACRAHRLLHWICMPQLAAYSCKRNCSCVVIALRHDCIGYTDKCPYSEVSLRSECSDWSQLPCYYNEYVFYQVS